MANTNKFYMHRFQLPTIFTMQRIRAVELARLKNYRRPNFNAWQNIVHIGNITVRNETMSNNVSCHVGKQQLLAQKIQIKVSIFLKKDQFKPISKTNGIVNWTTLLQISTQEDHTGRG